MHQPRQVAVAELRRREVDADLHRRGPARGLAAGCPQSPCADLADHAVLLGKRDEGVRRNEAVLGMLPAEQRLEAEHLAVDLGLRLVVQG